MGKELWYGAGGLVIGATIASLIAVGVAGNNRKPADNAQTSMTMADMVDSLKGKTGDDFDKAFLSSMIEHHQGAIDMAKLAKTNAKHDGIKNMANDIVSAQSKEISMMKTRQSDWGYESGQTSHEMMNH